MKKTFIKILSIVAIGILGISLTACGKKDDNTEDKVDYTDYTEYKSEFTTINLLSGDNTYSTGYSLSGDFLSYIEVSSSSIEVDGDTFETNNTYNLIKKNIKTGEESSYSLDFGQFGEYVYPSDFKMCEDGSFVGFVMSYSDDYEKSITYFLKIDSEGNIINSADVNNIFSSDFGYVNEMEIVSDGIVLSTGNSIVKIDFEGKKTGEIQLSSYVESISKTSNGKIVVCMDGDKGMQIKTLNDKCTDFERSIDVSGWGSAYGGKDDTIFYSKNKGLQVIDLKTGEAKDLFNWIDVDITETYFDSISCSEDGSFTVAYENYQDQTYNIVRIREALDSEKGTKKILTFGVAYLDSDLRSAVVKFNRSSDTTRISVVEYLNDDNIQYNDAIKNFGANLTNGKYDLVCLEGMSYAQYAKALEPLDSYIEKDLNKNDYFENVLNACSVDGKIYGMPKSFYVSTMAISNKYKNETGSWTLDDLIALRKKYPDKDFFSYSYQTQALYYAMMGSFDRFVDNQKGTCNFDSEEFKKVLEFAKTFKDDDAPRDEDYDDWGAIKNGDILLFNIGLNSLSELQLYNSLCPEGITLIGYPSEEGGKHIVETNTAVSISSKSKNKELAWEFIKSLLEYDNTQYRDASFDIQKDKTDAIMKKAMEKEIGPDGKEMSTMSWGNGYTTVDLYAATQQEVDMAYAAINAAKASGSMNSDAIDIILEECKAFFKGKKSADETAKVIQSRVSIMLAEQN